MSAIPANFKRFSLYTLAIASIVMTLLIGISISNDASDIDKTWQEYSKKEVLKSSALGEIVVGFGYGGFIHEFKNLILRHDQKYAKNAQESLIRTYSGIENFLALEDDQNIRDKIKDLKSTVDEYNQKLQLVQKLILENKSISQIDASSKTDDTQAVEALEVILLSIKKSTSKTLDNSSKKIDLFQNKIKYGFIFIIFCLIVSATLIALNFKSVFSAYKEINVLLSSVPNAIIVTDETGFVIKVNDKALEIFGYSKSEFKKMTIESFIPHRYRDSHFKERMEFQKSDRSIAMDNRNTPFTALRKNGEEFPVSISVSTYHANKGKNNIAVIKDMSIEKKLEEEASTDHLTNIANRKKCFEFLSNAINQTERYNNHLSVIMCDIDHFKKINDTHGHNSGDNVLVEVSKILSENIRKTDLIARWGGEEFMIICPNTSKSMAFTLAEKLRAIIKFSFEDSETPVTISLGVTEFNNEVDEEVLLIGRADSALYQSKNNGRDRTSVG